MYARLIRFTSSPYILAVSALGNLVWIHLALVCCIHPCLRLVLRIILKLRIWFLVPVILVERDEALLSF